MYIAVDDTDSREGMCTTFLATEMIKEFKDYQLLDYPRLVRLNPNVPWKTRGNGAIILTLGNGVEKEERIGNIEEEQWIFKGDNEKREKDFEKAKKVIEDLAHFQSSKTNPGLIVAEKRPSRELYEKAVEGLVELEEVFDTLDEGSFEYKGYGNKRGLIGALAALAWRPGDKTYELLTYRRKEKWGTNRELDEEDIRSLDRIIDGAFDSYDYEEDKQAIAPNSPCPVLYGVRGENPRELQKAVDTLGGEEPERWITFLTNQATDDHIQQAKISDAGAWNSVKIEGEICSETRSIEGGHVLFDVKDKTGQITAAAYEPTKDFREAVKKLIVGDKVELWGGVRKDPRTLNVEKMKILDLEEKIIKIRNPECPECGKRMSSMGTNAGYRCKRCRIKADEDEAVRKKVDRELSEKWYEVPVSARRHLSKPLKRIK
ncbi:MAG: tRNA(Ile)(2)-agmatinylcytidine synthase [Candidatus Thermoplasmatota archaeon]